MAALKSVFSQVKFKLQRSSLALKIILIITIMLSIAALISLRMITDEVKANTAALREHAAALEQSNSQILTDQADLGSVHSVIRIAEEKLGLVQPGSVMFQTAP